MKDTEKKKYNKKYHIPKAAKTLFLTLPLLAACLFMPTSCDVPGKARLFTVVHAENPPAQAAAKDDAAAQPAQQQALPENMETLKIYIPYITKDETIDTRPMWLYLPTDAKGPFPVVYMPHYETLQDAEGLSPFLSSGIAVASPADVLTAYNGMITDDDLVFNNAALYTLRHMPGIDNQRIMLIGGSAGGYMTLMMDALQMGTVASVANVPIVNPYYNFAQYFAWVNQINRFWTPPKTAKETEQLPSGDDTQTVSAAIEENLPAATGENLPAAMQENPSEAAEEESQPPVPAVALVSYAFMPVAERLGGAENYPLWEAFSPVALTGAFSSPILTSHNTSDVLVPFNQIDSEHAYEPGETFPEDYSNTLPRDNPGVLGRTFVEEMPQKLTKVNVTVFENPDMAIAAPFDENYLFNIDIFDNGAPQSYGDHVSMPGAGLIDYMGYVAAMMEKGLTETERLMPEKLLLLLERYQGKSLQLPAHVGIDDTVYGSLAIYQKEIVDEIKLWTDTHSVRKMEKAMQQAIAALPDRPEQEACLQAWEEIKGQL